MHAVARIDPVAGNAEHTGVITDLVHAPYPLGFEDHGIAPATVNVYGPLFRWAAAGRWVFVQVEILTGHPQQGQVLVIGKKDIVPRFYFQAIVGEVAAAALQGIGKGGKEPGLKGRIAVGGSRASTAGESAAGACSVGVVVDVFCSPPLQAAKSKSAPSTGVHEFIWRVLRGMKIGTFPVRKPTGGW